jgi:hypothetical protein
MREAVQVLAGNSLGIGLGRYGTVQVRFDPDDAHKAENWVLQVAVGTGVPGALAYIALTMTILATLLRRRNCVGVAAAAVFIAMTVASIMIPVWDLLLPTVYAWSLVGIGLAAGAPQRLPRRTPVVL